jgi:hypothetical protein
MEKHGKELLKKKEAKFAKIMAKKKQEYKDIKEKAELHDEKLRQRKKQLAELAAEHVREGEELFLKHLEEIKLMNEEKLRKQREACDIDYKRNVEQYQRSMNKQEAKMKESMEIEVTTMRNLQELEKRLT